MNTLDNKIIEKVIYSPMWYHTRGLMQTATGYGRKLVMPYKFKFADEKIFRRAYCCCFSNSGTVYYIVRGKPTYFNYEQSSKLEELSRFKE